MVSVVWYFDLAEVVGPLCSIHPVFGISSNMPFQYLLWRRPGFGIFSLEFGITFGLLKQGDAADSAGCLLWITVCVVVFVCQLLKTACCYSRFIVLRTAPCARPRRRLPHLSPPELRLIRPQKMPHLRMSLKGMRPWTWWRVTVRHMHASLNVLRFHPILQRSLWLDCHRSVKLVMCFCRHTDLDHRGSFQTTHQKTFLMTVSELLERRLLSELNQRTTSPALSSNAFLCPAQLSRCRRRCGDGDGGTCSFPSTAGLLGSCRGHSQSRAEDAD